MKARSREIPCLALGDGSATQGRSLQRDVTLLGRQAGAAGLEIFLGIPYVVVENWHKPAADAHVHTCNSLVQTIHLFKRANVTRAVQN
jgi:hypothetical protein